MNLNEIFNVFLKSKAFQTITESFVYKKAQ